MGSTKEVLALEQSFNYFEGKSLVDYFVNLFLNEELIPREEGDAYLFWAKAWIEVDFLDSLEFLEGDSFYKELAAIVD